MGWTPPHLIGIKVPDWKWFAPVNSEKESTMKVIRVGVDLAKKVFVRPESRVSLCFTGEGVT
jgi:hypothetical protein